MVIYLSDKSLDSFMMTGVCNKYYKKTGITKCVTVYGLCHSHATHLLESGIALRYIEELLGHNSSKTIAIYAPVSTKSIQQIKSLLMICETINNHYI